MGYIPYNYAEIEKTYRQEYNNVAGYKDGDEYAYASGCGVLHPFNARKREACEQAKLEKISAKQSVKQSLAEVAKIEAEALAIKASQAPERQMGAGAIVGIVVASILAITVMVVVIKKVKK